MLSYERLQLDEMRRSFTDQDFIALRIDGLTYRFYAYSPEGVLGFLFPPEYGKKSNEVIEVVFPTGGTRPVAKQWIHSQPYRLSFRYFPDNNDLVAYVVSDRANKDKIHQYFKRKGIPIPGKLENNAAGGVRIVSDDGGYLDVLWESIPQNMRFRLKELTKACR